MWCFVTVDLANRPRRSRNEANQYVASFPRLFDAVGRFSAKRSSGRFRVSFHLLVYVRSEDRRRLVTNQEPRTRDVGSIRVPDSAPHLRFTTRADASFFYHGSPKSWDEWHLIRVEPCSCENTVLDVEASQPEKPFWGPWIQRLPYQLRSNQTQETPVSH